jgi:hypothetical protein
LLLEFVSRSWIAGIAYRRRAARTGVGTRAVVLCQSEIRNATIAVLRLLESEVADAVPVVGHFRIGGATANEAGDPIEGNCSVEFLPQTIDR